MSLRAAIGSAPEFRLLLCLAERPGRSWNAELEALWDDEFVDDNTLSVNVTRVPSPGEFGPRRHRDEQPRHRLRI